MRLHMVFIEVLVQLLQFESLAGLIGLMPAVCFLTT